MNWRHLLVALVCLLPTLPVAAEMLQYSLAPNPHPNLQMRWQDATGRGKGNGSIMVAEQAGVELRLQIPPHYYSPPSAVRIYLGVPAAMPGLKNVSGFEVVWQAQERFISGSARPGQRVLLYDGVVDREVLNDVMHFSFEVDAAQTSGELSFEPVYEIEGK